MDRRWIVSLILVAMTVGPSAVALADPCGSPSADNHYFPGKLLQIVGTGIAEFFRSIGEPSLFCGKRQNVTSYRFYSLGRRRRIVRSSIRIERAGTRVTLESVEVVGSDEEDTGFTHTVSRKSRRLSLDDWRRISGLVDRSNFWSLPATTDVKLPHDGHFSLIEGRRANRYHAIWRWDFGEALAELWRDLDRLESGASSPEAPRPAAPLKPKFRRFGPLGASECSGLMCPG